MKKKGDTVITTMLIAVLGNIASGKTTLCEVLARILDATLIPEPVQKWKDNGLLEAFYQDLQQTDLPHGTPRTMPYIFQQFAFSSRLVDYKKVAWTDTVHVIADSHILSDRNVYAQALYDDGFFSDDQMRWYNESHEDWKLLVPEAVADVFVYLQTTPACCMKRIHARNRTEETEITEAYLAKLHVRYEALFQKLSHDDGVKIVKIDGDQCRLEVNARTLCTLKPLLDPLE